MTDHYDSPEPAWRRTRGRFLNLVTVVLLVSLMANMCWTFTQRRRVAPASRAPDTAAVPEATPSAPDSSASSR